MTQGQSIQLQRVPQETRSREPFCIPGISVVKLGHSRVGPGQSRRVRGRTLGPSESRGEISEPPEGVRSWKLSDKLSEKETDHPGPELLRGQAQT